MGFRNPVIPGFHPDPSLCRVGQDYYCVTSSFGWFPGLPVFHSRDLVHWRPIGHVFDRHEQLPVSAPQRALWHGIWAPTLRHHDGRFWCCTTDQSQNGNVLFSASDPAGPWSAATRMEHGGWDNSLWIEPDGDTWYHWIADGAIRQCRIDLASGRMLDEPRPIFAGTGAGGLEGPHLYHIGDWWYLLVAEGGTHWGHLLSIARSRSPWGPFEPSPHGPLVTHRHSEMSQVIKAVGHGDLIQAHDGSWWLLALGHRSSGWVCYGSHHMGRETFLAPVTWRDGWPLVNAGRDIALDMDVPTLPTAPWPEPAPDADLSGPALPPYWAQLRHPRPERVQVGNGRLSIHGDAAGLGDPGLALVGRRQQHWWCSCTARVAQLQLGADGAAGWSTYADEHHHSSLVLRSAAEGCWQLDFQRRAGSLQTREASVCLPPGPLELRIVAAPRWYRFDWRHHGGAWQEGFGWAETRHHATELAYGFTGVFLAAWAQNGSLVLDAVRYEAAADQSFTPDMPAPPDLLPPGWVPADPGARPAAERE